MSSALRFARKQLDVSVLDVAHGLLRCVSPILGRTGRRRATLDRLAARWEPAETVVACLSVRSGWDLLLGSVGWPAGSEVLMSGLTIPHLARLVREHGYVPVPVDVDLATLELDLDEVRDACTPRTRALVYAHLLGARAEVAGLASVATALGLLFVDDRAQSYDGTDRRLGPDADVAMYSFGTIKTASCFGGGVLPVRDPRLRDRMQTQQQGWPRQPRRGYAAKLVTGLALLALAAPCVYPVFVRLAGALTGDYDQLVRRLSRGYRDSDLLRQLRRQPSDPLLAVLARRLRRYDPAHVERRVRAGRVLTDALDPAVVQLGADAVRPTAWLVAVVSADPGALVAAGRAAGFDLTCGSSTLVALDECCRRAHRAMAGVVYLPAYGSIPDRDLRRLAAVVSAAERSVPGSAGAARPVVGPGEPTPRQPVGHRASRRSAPTRSGRA